MSEILLKRTEESGIHSRYIPDTIVRQSDVRLPFDLISPQSVLQTQTRLSQADPYLSIMVETVLLTLTLTLFSDLLT